MNKLLVKLASAWDKQISYVFCSSIVLFIVQLTYVEISSKNLPPPDNKTKISKPVVNIISTPKEPVQLELELAKPSSVEIQLTDQNGEIAKTNEESFLQEGKHTLKIDRPLKGKYFFTLMINHEIVYSSVITNNL